MASRSCIPSFRPFGRLARPGLVLAALCTVVPGSVTLGVDREHALDARTEHERQKSAAHILVPPSPADPAGTAGTAAGSARADLDRFENGFATDAWGRRQRRGDDVFFYTFETTNGNNLGLTVFNDGFVGNNLASREPSMEFPLGSNIEHLVRSGIWVAGRNALGDTLCSTATIAGYFGTRAFTSEFVPITGITELSILPNSRFYSPDARSEQDYRFSYADTVFIDRETEDHVPLNVQVNVETLLFSFEPFDAIVIMNFDVVNIHPTDPIFDVYVGFYSELASGYKDPADPNWTRGWFGNKDIGYVDSLRVLTEHHYNFDSGLAPTWAGISFLGTRPTPLKEMTASFNWWNWDDEQNRTGLAPIFDAERWVTMGNGQVRNTSGSEAPNQDPVTMQSAGPFGILESGDTLSFSLGFIGGEADPRNNRTAFEDLVFNAGWAQTAFDLNFNIPVPPPSPQLLVVPGHNRITLRWTDDPEHFFDPRSGTQDFEGYRIYVSESRLESDFKRILEADIPDSIFYNTGLDALEDPVTIDGVDYAYSFDIDGVRDGFKYWVSVTAFDTGSPDISSLESGLAQNRTFVIPGTPASGPSGPDVVVFPNPYRGDAAWDGALGRDRYLWFANLPARCTIRIYTLAGDLVDTIPFDQNGYTPIDIRGIYDPTDTRNPEADLPKLSGGMAAWDLVTRKDQGVASGLYMFSVIDEDTGDKQVGKFLIMK